MKHIKDEENLAYYATDIVDNGFIGSGVKLTPYVVVKNQFSNPKDLLSKLQKYDAGLSIKVDKQEKGEVILQGFVEDKTTQKSLANYYARASYDEKAGVEAKKDAFRKTLQGFVQEIMAYNAGNVKIK